MRVTYSKTWNFTANYRSGAVEYTFPTLPAALAYRRFVRANYQTNGNLLVKAVVTEQWLPSR